MINELENIKLIKELNYLKSDFDYKTNLVQIYNIDFFNSVDEILSLNSELKHIYDSKKNISIETANRPVDYDCNQELTEDSESEENTDLKGIYRQIVKMTHPDKIKNDNLNLIYTEANNAFKEGKIVDMILLCDKLGIPFEINQEQKELLKKEISDLRDKISLLESSYSFQWANGKDESFKTTIAVTYIKNAIF